MSLFCCFVVPQPQGNDTPRGLFFVSFLVFVLHTNVPYIHTYIYIYIYVLNLKECCILKQDFQHQMVDCALQNHLLATYHVICVDISSGYFC
jgi:hypothetical protein